MADSAEPILISEWAIERSFLSSAYKATRWQLGRGFIAVVHSYSDYSHAIYMEFPAPIDAYALLWRPEKVLPALEDANARAGIIIDGWSIIYTGRLLSDVIYRVNKVVVDGTWFR